MNIQETIRNYHKLRDSAFWFVSRENETKKLKSHYAPREEEISFEEKYEQDKENSFIIVWNFEINTSCHCHPRMQSKRIVFKLEDFEKYLLENPIYEE